MATSAALFDPPSPTAMAAPPSDSAVRAHLRTLVEKGLVRHKAEDLRYVYTPVEKPEKAMRRALEHLLHTFFDGSPSLAVNTLLDLHAADLDQKDLERLRARIEQARQEGR